VEDDGGMHFDTYEYDGLKISGLAKTYRCIVMVCYIYIYEYIIYQKGIILTTTITLSSGEVQSGRTRSFNL
jgi:hypothetical protein